ncbi:16S rRNA (cytosine967-C5)-methyltransferase [Nocardia alba]|uniref:16S rRNA (Cytosine967-C5)-methyltransferase n=1 Tax=Nocardia alba TaxID=225051 RepID=A0A4V2PAW9_9NOCA|nr:16S rRNA (cytosine967-C5)-methyltransferase [Nocardia alba]
MSASDRRRRREADAANGVSPRENRKPAGKSGASPRDDRKITGKNVDGGWAARAAKGTATPRADGDRWTDRGGSDRPRRDDRDGGTRSGAPRRADDRPGFGGANDRAQGRDSGDQRGDRGGAGRTGAARSGVGRSDRGASRPDRGARAGDSRGRGAGTRDAGEQTSKAPTQRRPERPDPSVPSPRKRRGEPVDPAREVALDVLRAVRERDAYANLALPKLLRERKISGRDAAFATELTYGASRSQGQLDAVISACAGRPVDEIDGPILDILRLGVYQLLRTRTGAHAAVDTSVDLASAEFGQGRAGFVNAVLRRAGEKTADEWVAELAPADPVGKLAFEHAHPKWIAQSFADALGARAGELDALLTADDERPIVHLVARPGEITAEELALVTGGEEGRWSPYAVYLDGGDPGLLEPVRDGIAAVQDEGSQLVALALTRAPLEGPDTGRWLDLCAGPGGKAALLGALAAIDLFTVDAVEPAEHRAELVRKSTRNLPVTVHVADGRDSGLTPGYDRVLVDAPCTGLGALRRRPEARWRRTPADVAELVTLQRELLTAAWDLVRPGGVVVYSTCSPHLAETVSVVADFVRRTGAEELDSREFLPGVTELGDGPSAQLWPHRHGTDAMFLATLRKK